MSETPREKVLSSLLFLTRGELMEINEKINALLGSNVNVQNSVDDYFRQMKQEGNILQAVKEYKDKTGCGLKEAKDYIDNL
jgi:ribosomal protein L7/L12